MRFQGLENVVTVTCVERIGKKVVTTTRLRLVETTLAEFKGAMGGMLGVSPDVVPWQDVSRAARTTKPKVEAKKK